MLSAAKELLPNESRLQACLSLRVEADDPNRVDYAENVNRARMTNICHCGNPHICPNCGPLVAEEKKRLIQADIAAWVAEGFTACSAVVTLQHVLCESLTDVDERVDKALRWLWDSKSGRAFKQKWSAFHRQRGVDVTYGQNGWHPHRNLVLYLNRRSLSEIEKPEFEAELKKLWVLACEAVGGYADYEHGCFIRFDRLFDFADYMASKAMGCGYNGSEVDNGKWGVAEEVTKHQYKTANGGSNPTELLNAYMVYGSRAAISRVIGDDEGSDQAKQEADKAGRLWQEYATVFKGKKFLDATPGLRKLLEDLKRKHEISDQPEGEKPEWKAVAYLGREAWIKLVKLEMTLWLIEEVKAAKGDALKVREFLEEAGITQVYYPALDPEYPDWWLAPEGTPAEDIEKIRDFNKFVTEWNADTGPP